MSSKLHAYSLLSRLLKAQDQDRLHIYRHIIGRESSKPQVQILIKAIVDSFEVQLRHSPKDALTELNAILATFGDCQLNRALHCRLYSVIVNKFLECNESTNTRMACATTLALTSLTSKHKAFESCTHIFWIIFNELYDVRNHIDMKLHLFRMMAILLTCFDQRELKYFAETKLPIFVDLLECNQSKVQLEAATVIAVVFTKFRGFGLLQKVNAKRQLQYLQLKLQVEHKIQQLLKTNNNKSLAHIWKYVNGPGNQLNQRNHCTQIDSIEKRIINELFILVFGTGMEDALRQSTFIGQMLNRPNSKSIYWEN